VAELFVKPEVPPEESGLLLPRYHWELWKRLLEHTPRCMAYLREHGVEAWLERYGLPEEPYEEWASEYVAGHSPMGWWVVYTPPKTPPPPEIPSWDPASEPAERWREKVHRALEAYVKAVEEAYQRAGWEKVRVKLNWEHFTWLALRLEGLSWAEIADRAALALDVAAVRLAVKRLAAQLGVRLKSGRGEH
jgi:hypothetical protein